MTQETQKTTTVRADIVFGLLLFYALSTLFSMAAMSIGVGAVALAFLLLDRKRERWRNAWADVDFRRYCGLSLAIVLAALASLLSAAFWPLPYQEPLSNALAETRKLAYFAVPLVYQMAAFDVPESRRVKFVRSFWLMLGVLGLIGVQQHWTGWPRRELITGAEGSARYASVLFMGLSLSVASALSVSLFPVLSRLLQRVTTKQNSSVTYTSAALSWVDRPLFLSVAALAVSLTILLTFSRMAWVALPVGMLLLSFFYLNRRQVALLLIAVLLGGALFTQTPVVQNRLQYQGGYSDRMLLWEGHLELFRIRPIFGVGWRQNSKLVDDALQEKHRRENRPFPADFFQSHAHNVWIETAAGQGIFGLLAFFLWNLWLAIYLYRSQKQNPEWRFWYAGALIGLVVLHINGFTQVNFWDSKVFHQVLILVATAFLLSGRKPANPV